MFLVKSDVNNSQRSQLIFNHIQDQAGHQSSGKFSKGRGKWKGGASGRKNQSLYMNVCSETLWLDIQEFAKLKYQVSFNNNLSNLKGLVSIYTSCEGEVPSFFCPSFLKRLVYQEKSLSLLTFTVLIFLKHVKISILHTHTHINHVNYIIILLILLKYSQTIFISVLYPTPCCTN